LIIAIEIFGWLGAIAILSAYLMNSFGLIKTGVLYQCLNIGGSLGLFAVSILNNAYPPAALNAVWFLAGLLSLAQILRENRSLGMEKCKQSGS